MPILKHAEVQLLRWRALQVSTSAGATVYWDPLNEGSFIEIELSDASTIILDFTYPAIPSLTAPSGLEIWVGLDKQGGAAGSITWPGTFKFQTLGDKAPNPNDNSFTLWNGIVRPGLAQVFMAKVGEWVAGGV